MRDDKRDTQSSLFKGCKFKAQRIDLPDIITP